jgi:hypothetical protein
VIALGRKLCLTGLHFRLLQTEDVRIKILKYLVESLAENGSESVYIP